MGSKSVDKPLKQRIRSGEIRRQDVTRRLAELAFGKANDCVKLALEEDSDKTDAPCVRVHRADGSFSGLAFHGVPGGHEFTSFVLGLYNAAGPGQSIDEDIRKEAEALQPADMKVLVSLSCTMCPDLVLAAQRIASLNAHVSAEVYDITHFPALREKYNVMSVPCLVVNDGERVTFGKKNIRQLVDLLK